MVLFGNKPQGAYDYLRDYSYPFVRDALIVLVEYVLDGDHRLNENMELRGCAILYPRNDKDAELLRNLLESQNVKFEEYGDAIKFKYGQDHRIDDTVRRMSNDLSLRNANEILSRARDYEHKPDIEGKQQALNQLKEMITNIEEVQSAGGRQRYFYFYFPADKIDLADELLQKLDVHAEKHISHLDDIETTVLRYPSTMIPGYFIQVYGELERALRARKAKGAIKKATVELIDKNAALELAKKEITGFAWVGTGGLRYLYFTFPTDFMTEGQELLRTLGISTEYYISHLNDSVEGIPVLRMVEPTAKNAIWNVLYELRDAATAKRLPNTMNRGGRQGM